MTKHRSEYPSEQADKFVVRLPDGMRDRIAKAAKENGRSMNAEIVATLEGYYPPEPAVPEILEQIDTFIGWAKNEDFPFVRADGRRSLIDALKELQASLSKELPDPDSTGS